MKILLVTDVPPCSNYTAGMVLGQIVKVLPKGSVACFCVMNPDLQNVEFDPELSDLPLEFAAKPQEAAFPRKGIISEVKSNVAEQFRLRSAIPDLMNRIVDFAHRQNVDTIWAVLQGQTMVRLAGRLASRLQMPLFCHVWDPLTWWLQANAVDRWTSRRALAEFDAAVQRSQAVATASPAMSIEYENKYGVRSVALIACHDHRNSFTPPGRAHKEGELIIGMAGQFYAYAEWQTLVETLNNANWAIGGREIRLLVLGHWVPDSPIPAGKIEFMGWRSQQETIRILSERADVLYCPYSFDPSMSEVSRLSFPSKLVSYFAAGRPVLLHAPVDSSPARYLKETGAGFVTVGSGMSNVHNAIERLAEDATLFADLAAASQRVFAAEFTLDRMRERVLEFLGVEESALKAAPAARAAFVASPASRIPPPRTTTSSFTRVRRAILAVARQTPLRPVAEMGMRGVHAYYRQKGAAHRIYYLASDRLRLVRQRRRGASVATVQNVIAAANALKLQHAQTKAEMKARLDIIEEMVMRLSPIEDAIAEASRDVKALSQSEGHLNAFEGIVSQLTAQCDRIAEDSREIKALVQRLDADQASLTKMFREHQHITSLVRDLEIANSSLTKQLEGSDRAYKALADTHLFLNERFDSVASASLAKLDHLSKALATSGSKLAGADVDGSRYLDLLEMVLTGEAFSDPSISPWSKPGFSAETRLIGRDWPQNGLTMIGRTRLRNIRSLINDILEQNTPGDFIETGVWRGGACIYMRAILDAYKVTDRTVWVADSFQGLPEPDEEHFTADAGDTHHKHAELSVSADQVRANFQRFGLLDDQVRFLEGWFKDTLPAAPMSNLALLRLDGDMYESTWEALEALYHRVSSGGFIIIDDYILPSCAKAIKDWRAQENITTPLQEVDGAAVYWQKV